MNCLLSGVTTIYLNGNTNRFIIIEMMETIVKTRLIARQTRKQGEQLVVVNMNGV